MLFFFGDRGYNPATPIFRPSLEAGGVMKNDKMTVFEKNGTLYYHGAIVSPGEYVKIEGVAWKVLGGGRSIGKSQAPFLWVRNERFGTSIFAPTLDAASPHRTPRPIEKEMVPKLQYPKPWRLQDAESLPLNPDFSSIASLSKASVAPERWARFKKEIIHTSRKAAKNHNSVKEHA